MRYAIMLFVLATACTHDRPVEPVPRPSPTPSVGWDATSMRCRAFDGTKFRGEFLDDSMCADQPKPRALEE